MRTSELRDLVPVSPPKRELGAVSVALQCGLAFVVGVGAFALYLNPNIGRRLIGARPVEVAAVSVAKPAAPEAKPAQAAALEEKANDSTADADGPLTMIDEQFTASFKMAGEMMTDNPEDAKQMEQMMVQTQNPAMSKLIALAAGPSIMSVKLYLGGKTSHAMADKCRESAGGTGGGEGSPDIDSNALAAARFANCYLTTNVARLCNANQKQVLADVVQNYYSSRDFRIRELQEDIAARKRIGAKRSTIADWDNPASREIAQNLKQLATQGYIARGDFGWFPSDEVKEVLNGTAVEQDLCARQKS